MNSIRGRLTRSFAQIILLALAISGTLGFLTARHEIDELFDAQLVEEARVLAGVLSLPARKMDWIVLQQALAHTNDAARPESQGDGYDAAYEKKVAVQVWSQSGSLLFRTHSAPRNALAPLRPGFYSLRTPRHAWHVYTHYVEANRYWLLVAERSDVRRELSLNVAASLIIGFLASLALAIVLLRKHLQRDLMPLVALRQAISQRQMDDLQEIHLEEEPEEIRPVTHALNHLFGEVSRGIERERAFIADAAHELRTPLSIIRLHAQNALQHSDPERKNQSLQKVIQGVDRNTRVVQQLLMMARLDATDGLGMPVEAVDLGALSLSLLHDIAPMLERKGQQVSSVVPEGLPPVSGNPELLSVLIRNLMDNAVNYTPAEGSIRLELVAADEGLWLMVEDSGPGVPEDRLAMISQRFVRAAPRDSQGHGLGLEIVGRIVRLHRGEIRFQNREQGGFAVRVWLPAAPSPTPFNNL